MADNSILLRVTALILHRQPGSTIVAQSVLTINVGDNVTFTMSMYLHHIHYGVKE